MSDGGELLDRVVRCIEQDQYREFRGLMVQYGGKICKMKDGDGEWLLIKALNWERFRFANLLLARGANPRVRSREHKVPAWDIALQTESTYILKALLKHGLRVRKAVIMKRLNRYRLINKNEFEGVINRFILERRVDNARAAIAAGKP